MSDMQARFQDLKACYEHMQRRSEAPSLTQWLPYREYDAQLALYFNTRNIGFAKDRDLRSMLLPSVENSQ